MNTRRTMNVVLATVLTASVVALADQSPDITDGTSTKPVQLALFPPDLQLVPAEQSISGFRLGIYASNQHVRGVDLALVNEVVEDFTGVGFGLAHLVHGDSRGLQMSGIYSDTKGHISGAQVGIFNHAGSMKGVQIGLVNMADEMEGFQFGLFNEIKSKDTLPVLPLINANF